MNVSPSPEHPSSPNAYEDSAMMGADGLRQRILDELSTFGEVVSLTGNIDNTQRHGIVLQNVSAVVHHPWIRTPMHINVHWNGEARTPRYLNELGGPIRFDENYGDAEILTEDDERILNLVMSRLRGEMAWSPVNPAEFGGGTQRREAALLGGGVGALIPVGANLAFWDPSTAVAVLASAGLAGVVGAMGERFTTRSLRAHLRQVNASVKAWNRNPPAAFETLFANSSERTAFLDALLSACAAAGIDYHGDLESTTPWVRSTGQKWSYRDTTDKLLSPVGDLLAPLTGAMIRFRGEAVPHYKSGEILFDGRRFFVCASQEGKQLVIPLG